MVFNLMIEQFFSCNPRLTPAFFFIFFILRKTDLIRTFSIIETEYNIIIRHEAVRLLLRWLDTEHMHNKP